MATNVFWAKGFDGATIDDLVEAMGVRRPSLYAIFGDKSDLFMRCLEAYRDGLKDQAAKALFGPTDVRVAIRSFLRFSVERATDPALPRGCLVVCVAPLVKDENVRRFLAKTNEEATEAVTMRLNQGVESKELPLDFACRDRSRIILDISRGLVVTARHGVSRQYLLEDADRAAELVLRA